MKPSRVGVFGLGYVDVPLAVLFARKNPFAVYDPKQRNLFLTG